MTEPMPLPEPAQSAVRCFLGLGSNEGDREAALRAALAALDAVPGVRVVGSTKPIETEFVGEGPVQPDYMNAVVAVDCWLPPLALLAACKELERQAGRKLPAPKNHPRPLDVDVLLIGDASIDTRDLVVPHPELCNRAFVMEPLRALGVQVDRLCRGKQGQPELLHTKAEIAARSSAWQAGACVVGLVPTMGALHDGHASLFAAARRECDRVIATVFVNPLQFDHKDDLGRYPRALEADLKIMHAHGVDAVWCPDEGAVYGAGFASRVAVGHEARGLEGESRSGHFEGVATVVAILLATVRPQRVYFGQKDAQQVAVIERLVRDLGLPTEVVPCPIVREADGLAMSSRNRLLDPQDRAASVALVRAIEAAQALWADGERGASKLADAARAVLVGEPRCTMEYLELRDAELQPVAEDAEITEGRLLVAARFDGPPVVRLIDNATLGGQ